jgi:hypothetical protein
MIAGENAQAKAPLPRLFAAAADFLMRLSSRV